MGSTALATTGDGQQKQLEAEMKIGVLLQAFQTALIESDKRKDEKLPWNPTSVNAAGSSTWATDLLPADYDQWEIANKKYEKERDVLNKFVEDFPKQIKDLCDQAGRRPDDVVASIERTLQSDVDARRQATIDAERRLRRFGDLVLDVFGPKPPDPVKVLEQQVADALSDLRDGFNLRFSDLSFATAENGARLDNMTLSLQDSFQQIAFSLDELRAAVDKLGQSRARGSRSSATDTTLPEDGGASTAKSGA